MEHPVKSRQNAQPGAPQGEPPAEKKNQHSRHKRQQDDEVGMIQHYNIFDF